MNKVKVSSGVASIILIASLFAGIGTTLTVAVLLLLFCDVEDFKRVLVRVLSFTVALVLFTTIWGLVVNLYDVFLTIIDSFVSFIDSYLKTPLDVTGLYKYLLTPVKIIINMVDSVVDYIVAIVKIAFVIIFLKKKDVKETFISKFVSNFINALGC